MKGHHHVRYGGREARSKGWEGMKRAAAWAGALTCSRGVPAPSGRLLRHCCALPRPGGANRAARLAAHSRYAVVRIVQALELIVRAASRKLRTQARSRRSAACSSRTPTRRRGLRHHRNLGLEAQLLQPPPPAPRGRACWRNSSRRDIFTARGAAAQRCFSA